MFLFIASSVAVSAWTLVAIALERYYAICDPLRSRRWQTLRHAYKLIALIWCGSFIFMSPIAIFSQLIPTSHGEYSNSSLLNDNVWINVYFPHPPNTNNKINSIINDTIFYAIKMSREKSEKKNKERKKHVPYDNQKWLFIFCEMLCGQCIA